MKLKDFLEKKKMEKCGEMNKSVVCKSDKLKKFLEKKKMEKCGEMNKEEGGIAGQSQKQPSAGQQKQPEYPKVPKIPKTNGGY